jgi:hypothetical protein
MTVKQQIFVEQNLKLKIDLHPSDTKFLIVRNCNFNKGSELCKKYKASGMSSGKNSEDFQIGNFGRYN